MILQLFSSLLLLSLLALLIVQGHHRHFWSIVMLVVGSWLGYELYLTYLNQANPEWMYHWLSYKKLQASLNLSTTAEFEKIVLFLFGSFLVLIYYNSIYKGETHAMSANIVIMLNLAAFILLINSGDFIQLMTGSCAFSIIGFYLINDTGAKQKYVFYNFLAEMFLFTALAIVYGYTGSISLTQLSAYQRDGWHQDLVVVLLLIAIFAKSGLVLFQNQLLEMQKITFNRMIILCFSSTPLAALVLMTKLQPLLLSSEYYHPVLKVIVGLSLLWGLCGMLLIDNFKAKVIYFNLMFFSFAVAILNLNPENLANIIEIMLPAVLMINFLLLMVYIASSHESYVSQLGGFINHLAFPFAMTMLGGFILISAVLSLSNAQNAHLIWIYLGCSLLGLAHVLRNIYLGSVNTDDRVMALLKNPSVFYWVPLLALEIGIIYWLHNYTEHLLYWVWLGFVTVFVLGPTRFCNRWVDNETLQDGDLMAKVYHGMILVPLRLLGRILWIAVDFLLIERSIIGSISQVSRLLIIGMQRIQTALWINYLLMVLLGLGMIAFAVGYHYYE